MKKNDVKLFDGSLDVTILWWNDIRESEFPKEIKEIYDKNLKNQDKIVSWFDDLINLLINRDVIRKGMLPEQRDSICIYPKEGDLLSLKNVKLSNEADTKRFCSAIRKYFIKGKKGIAAEVDEIPQLLYDTCDDDLVFRGLIAKCTINLED